MRSKLWVPVSVLIIVILPVLQCGRKDKGPTQQGKSNEELIKERFALYKEAFQNQDVGATMSLIATTYYDPYNHSNAEYRSWLQGLFAAWRWNSVEMNIAGDIEIEPGWGWISEGTWLNAKANHGVETQIRAIDDSNDILMSSKSGLSFSWELMEEIWYITRIYGTVAQVLTQPSTVSKGAEVTVSVYTLPEGAPLSAYDTQSANIKDWNGDLVPLEDQGNGLFTATFSAPTASGEYTLTATVADTTWNKTIQVTHRFLVQ